jgi:sugar lactone lactonase YvrE
MRVNHDGTGVTTMAPNQDKPTGITVTPDTLYWSNYGEGKVMKLSLPAGKAATPMVSGLTSPYDLVSDGTSIYFADNADPGAVYRNGFSDPNPTPLASGLKSPSGIAVDASYVYWTNNGDGTVMRTSLQGGAALTLSSGEAAPWDIAVDANDVYFTTLTAVRRVPRSGGGAVDLATDQSNPWSIAVDASGIYWTNHNNDTVMRLAPGANMPTVIASGTPHPGHIALDATCVYWTEVVNPGSVRKLAK